MTSRFDPAGIVEVLNRHGVEYVVIGGWAAIGHGVRRATADIDVVPAPAPENSERLSSALVELRAQPAVDSQFLGINPSDPFDVARARNVRYVTELGRLDVLRAPAGLQAYSDLDDTAMAITIGDAPTRIADRDRLIAMKRAAGRPRDMQDIADLTAGEADDLG